MRVLVTGGAGFIGSHVIEALLAAGTEVEVLDDLSSGEAANVPPRVRLVVGDVCDRDLLARVVPDFDAVVHLAAIASVQRCADDWFGAHRVNVSGAVAVFDAASSTGRRIPVVYASSAAVYGRAGATPSVVGGPVDPSSAYGADKLGCELHARAGAESRGLVSVGLRFFNVYGPRQKANSPYSGAISLFVSSMVAGRRVSVFGDGQQTRDFVSVVDVARAVVAAVGRAGSLPRGSASVLDVCTGVETSVLDLVASVAAATGVPASFDLSAGRPGEVRRSVGDPAAMRGLFGPGWSPVPLSRGLPDLVAAQRLALGAAA